MYIPGRLRTASRPSSTVMSLAPYSLGASAGVSGVGTVSSWGSTAKVSALSLATGAFDSSVLDVGRSRSCPRRTAAANGHVTDCADYSDDGGSQLPQEWIRDPTTFHRRSVIYANSIVETRESLQIRGQPRAEYADGRPLALSAMALRRSRWVPIRPGGVETPCTPFSRKYPGGRGR